MSARTIITILGAGTLAIQPAAAQVCPENICFIDRGASGEIHIGPLFGGASVIDFDNDNYPDLIIRDRVKLLARLFHNQPDPNREGQRTFVDVTETTGFTDYQGVSATPAAALVADFNNDGFSDVYLMGRRTIDTAAGRLYRNEGNGTFTDVTAIAGVAGEGDDPESASWVDFDLDGFVDLMVASRNTSQHPLRLFRNQQDGTFIDVSTLLPTLPGWSRMYAHTWSDFDSDGYPDAVMIPTSGPALLHNVPDGSGGRMFIDVAAARGYNTLGPAPMGISTGDYDNDGDFDIGLSNGAVGIFYENVNASFEQRTFITSLWGWGTLWLDVNNDGRLDLYQAGSAGFSRNFNKLFINRGAGVFDDLSAALNDTYVNSQHAAQFDFNNDGRQDIVTVNPGNTPTFIGVSENVSSTGNRWFKLRVKGDGSRVNSDAIGAVVRIVAGGVTQSREITSGSSTSSNDDFRVSFGLGAAAVVDRIEIVWPRLGSLADRTEVLAGPFAADQIIDVRPSCAADFNRDGAADSQDFFDFVIAFLNLESRADFDASGTIDSQDFFSFLTAFFAGCE